MLNIPYIGMWRGGSLASVGDGVYGAYGLNRIPDSPIQADFFGLCVKVSTEGSPVCFVADLQGSAGIYGGYYYNGGWIWNKIV